MSDPNDISLTVLPDGVLVEDRRNNISELTLISERSLLLTCPFTGATSLVHTQAQVNAHERVVAWHAATLTAERDELRAENARLKAPMSERPKVICLCGSTRFIEMYAVKTWELERQGNIVLGCTLLPGWYCNVPDHFGEATGTKEQCDELHKRKIDLADEILVLNYEGYIGESTRGEIDYACAQGKPVFYVEAPATLITARSNPPAQKEQP